MKQMNTDYTQPIQEENTKYLKMGVLFRALLKKMIITKMEG